MTRPFALDLFCGAGGASMGLHQAGFDVTGVDIQPQPHYPFRFVQADALRPPFDLREFAFIWASPPCQGFTAYKRRRDHVRPRENLIPETRRMLLNAGVRYIMENVPGAPLHRPFTLCGSMFGLDVRRHRVFEPSFNMNDWFWWVNPQCNHAQAKRFQQATNRQNRRRTVEVGVWRIPLAVQQAAMGVDWMELEELSQAIPPAYSEFIGGVAIRAITPQMRVDE